MKIAYITNEYPDDKGTGGIGTYTYQIAQVMSSNGHYVEVFSSTDKDSFTKESNNLKVNFIHTTKEDFKYNLITPFIKRNNEIKFDVIEGAEYGADAIELLKQYPDLPFVIKLHTPSFIFSLFGDYYIDEVINKNIVKSLKQKIHNILFPTQISDIEQEEKNITKLAKYVCSPSKKLAEIIEKRWNIKNIQIVENIFNSQNIDFKKTKQNIFQILFVGKMSYYKGCYDLIDIINRLSKKINSFRFVICGKDLKFYENNSMIEFIKSKLSNPSVLEYKGVLSFEEVKQEFSKADVFVCPSMFENFPTVLLESMTYQCPIVAYKVGGIPEMIKHNFNGLLVKKHDTKGFAEQIIRLYQDKDLSNKIIKNSLDKIKNYSTNIMLPKILDFYNFAQNLNK